MLKILFLSGLLILPSSMISFASVVFFLFLYLFSPLPILISFPGLDFWSLSLILLTLWLMIFMLKANFFSRHRAMLCFSFIALILFLSLSFMAQSLLMFYLFFEASLIPIFWIVLTWGYQPERLLASLMMFFYTLASSFPLLALILIIWWKSFSLSLLPVFVDVQMMSSWVSLAAMLAFLVKFPVYAAHIWLPKAHVEAPVSGSMILAGILLKLGGYGLYRMSNLFIESFPSLVWGMAASVGGSILSIFCCRTTDMKILIAYSSVVHMALIIFNLLVLESSGLLGAWWVMLAHGLVSSGMFAMANLLYERSHSRSMLINKGFSSNGPSFTIFWFIILMSNFAGPFTLNLLGEIYLIIGAMSTSSFLVAPVAFLSFFSAAYSLLLFTSTQHGVPSSSNLFMVLPNSRELNLMLGHVWPVVLILLSLGL